jgi:hypothetical protein
MRPAFRNEIDYLGSLDSEANQDPKLIEEMRDRLDALRRYDQDFNDSDWRPHVAHAGWRPDLPFCAI